MNYYFYITYGSVITQVYPLNWLECSLVDQIEQGQVFYRRKFEGVLTFGGKKLCDDFNYFYDIETSDPCETLYLSIYLNEELYAESKFSTSDGEWDLDNKTFTVTPILIDYYNEFLDGGEVEYNILDAGLDLIETNVYKEGIYDETYSRNLWLVDVIEYIIQQIAGTDLKWSDDTIKSDFLTEATNPITLGTNKYTLLSIAQKSDIKRPDASNPATVGMLSFNGLMEILKMMNLYWKYDGTTFEIEHVSHWSSVAGLDIRTQDLTANTNKYRYTKEEIPKYEKFFAMEANNKSFLGYPIWYDSACTNQDPAKNVSEFKINVSTDIEYILDCVGVSGDETKISDDGWVLFANELIGAVYYVRTGYSNIESRLIYNYDLGWEGLHDAFFRHDRQLIEGYLNNTLTTFYSARKIKEQECNIVSCQRFYPEKYITTELGETYFGSEKGYVSKATIKPYGEINLTLVYGPEATEPEPPIETKWVSLIEDKTGALESTIYALISEAAPFGGLQIGIRLEIKASNDATSWTDLEEIDIPEGSTSGSVLITWTEPGPGPLCVNDYDTVDPAGWSVSVIISDTSSC